MMRWRTSSEDGSLKLSATDFLFRFTYHYRHPSTVKANNQKLKKDVIDADWGRGSWSVHRENKHSPRDNCSSQTQATVSRRAGPNSSYHPPEQDSQS